MLEEKERDQHDHCNLSLTDHVQHTVCNIITNNLLYDEILKGLITVIDRPTDHHCQPRRYANMAKRNYIFLFPSRCQIHEFWIICVFCFTLKNLHTYSNKSNVCNADRDKERECVLACVLLCIRLQTLIDLVMNNGTDCSKSVNPTHHTQCRSVRPFTALKYKVYTMY